MVNVSGSYLGAIRPAGTPPPILRGIGPGKKYLALRYPRGRHRGFFRWQQVPPALVKVVAIDRAFFPWTFKLRLGGELRGDEIDLLHERKYAWIYPEARLSLELISEKNSVGRNQIPYFRPHQRGNWTIISAHGSCPQGIYKPRIFEGYQLTGRRKPGILHPPFSSSRGPILMHLARDLKAINSPKSTPTPTVRPDTGQVGSALPV